MKNPLILLSLLLPFIGVNQVNDTVSTQVTIEFEIAGPVLKEEIQKVDLAWADTLIQRIEKVCFVQLRPVCRDRKKRKTLAPFPAKRKKGCHQETVILARDTFLNRNDPRSHETLVTGFDLKRIYKWKEVDSLDYSMIFESAFGKRQSAAVNMCYNPRHAILFLDSEDVILGMYELCFECGNGKLAIKYVESINIYHLDYRVLQELFTKYGYSE